ncbi:putative Sexual differentiation process protein isp4 [Glarea lozoyensis 74030]|uniref:Putative Sexual differentiation process protein isp4 n=1 Tax=Glarea lozoyensis (strain ATCC 74030 / MF5533) TaxID=1104152 RepID=H0EI89_GLAL7|nr:putative Sexual differentiation process protein isp4 [Glarea lozoyensis 74030]
MAFGLFKRSGPRPDEPDSLSSGVDNPHTAQAVQADLKAFQIEHKWDPNLPQESIAVVSEALRADDLEKKVAVEVNLLEEDSPYPEVRAAVRNYDDETSANTVRAWVIGILWTTIGSAVNMLFSLRNPSIALTPVVTLLLSYPFGVAWTYDGQNFGWGYQLLLTITCQMLGLGLAGLTRRWLVEPAAMIWPSNLITTTMFETIHTRKTPDALQLSGWKIGRYKWFLIVMGAIFVWEWFPLWIAPLLATFTFACWIAPNNVTVNQVFGGQTGLSLIPLTFDWSVITAFVLSPLVYPFHAIGNTMIGVVIFTIITSLGIHFTGALYSDYLPMSTGGSFDNTGAAYNVSKILTPEYTLDPEKYAAYSPLFLSTTFALAYGLSFAAIIAVIVHTYLYHGTDIWHKLRASRSEGADIHQKMMLKYPQAPIWWFMVSFAVFLALGFVTCLVWDTHLTWWAFIIAILISVFFYLPIGIVQATTNVQLGLNVITEFIIGYMQPGRPLAMMMFKMYGYITCYQGLYFTQDQKLAHYMKVPQRVTFWAQFIATLWSCFVQIAVLNWALGNIKDVCDPDQPAHYSCPNAHVFFTASIIWGVIGPERIFGSNGIYNCMMYFFILGLVCPILVWLAARKWPNSILRYVSTPVIFGGTAYIPPATVMIYASWGFVGTMFNKVIKGRHPGWWTEYTYITSAALDSGTIICVLLIFFALQLPDKVSPPQWWGGFNGGFMNNVDWNATPKIVLTNGTFGPTSWK